MKIIKHDYNGSIISQDREGHVSLTDMAQAVGKRVNDYSRLSSTQEYIEALSVDTGIPMSDLIRTIKGGDGDQGTWAHPEVAKDFDRWLKVKKKDKCRAGVLYIYSDEANNAFKVGFTTDLKRRERQHRTSHPFLELVKTYDGVTIDFEQVVHVKLKDYRIGSNAEWYRDDPRVITTIDLLFNSFVE